MSRPAAWAVIAVYGAVVALVLFGQATYASVSQRVLVTLLVAVMATGLCQSECRPRPGQPITAHYSNSSCAW